MADTKHREEKTLISNAYNNWSRRDKKLLAYPKSTIELFDFSGLEAHGYKVFDVMTAPAWDLRAAMDEYKATTDWSVFSKSDWEAAYKYLD